MIPLSRRGQWAAVGGVFAAIAVAATIWLAIDRRPPEWDHANHLERAVLCAKDLDARDARAILERSSFYLPLVACAAAVVYRLLPSDAAAAQSVILAFLGLGMVAAYLLGRRLASGAAGVAAAVAAAVVFGTAPFVLFSALRLQLDLPLATLVAFGLLALLVTDGFRLRAASLLAGLVFGVGMLTKPTFAAYLLPPIVWVLLRERTRRAVGNAVLALAVAVVIALPWYGPRAFGLPLHLAREVEAAVRRQAADVARDVEDLRVVLDYDAGILQGRIRRAEITAGGGDDRRVQARDAARLRVRDVRLVVEDLLVNPFSAHAEGWLDLLDAGRLRLEAATVSAADLDAFLHGLKNFRRTTVRLLDGAVEATMAQPGPDVSARVRFEPGSTGLFTIRADEVRVGPVPVPGRLVTWIVRHYDPVPKLTSRLPFPVDIGRIMIDAQSLRVTAR